MSRGILLLCLLGTLLVLGGSVSGAALARAEQTPPPAEPEPPSANEQPAEVDPKALQARAAQLFHANQFVEAAELLQLVYKSEPRPILLFNAGQAYRKAERAAEAQAMYEQFLTVAPAHALAPEARGYIKDMAALLAMQQRAREVALALEEHLAATESSKQQAALALQQERQRAQSIKQALLRTEVQLAQDRKKLASRRRWILGLALGIPVTMAAIIGGAAGAFYYSRASTDGGTAVIEK